MLRPYTTGLELISLPSCQIKHDLLCTWRKYKGTCCRPRTRTGGKHHRKLLLEYSSHRNAAGLRARLHRESGRCQTRKPRIPEPDLRSGWRVVHSAHRGADKSWLREGLFAARHPREFDG